MIQRFVNFNPFQQGFSDFKIERLAMVYTQDLPWCLHHASIHPSHEAMKDFEFENQEAVFDDHHVSLKRCASKARLDECRYRGQLIKIIYRVLATEYASQVIIGQALSLLEAERMIYNIQIQTGHYNRCFEISSSHLPANDLRDLKERAEEIPQIVDAPFLLDLFLINNERNDNFDLGIRLNRTPWTEDDLLQKVLCSGSTDLREDYLEDGLSTQLIDLLLLAGKADVRLIIFSDNAPILPRLATY